MQGVASKSPQELCCLFKARWSWGSVSGQGDMRDDPSGHSGMDLVPCVLTPACLLPGDELEYIRPNVYRNIARQLNISLHSETVVTDAFLAVAAQIFTAGTTHRRTHRQGRGGKGRDGAASLGEGMFLGWPARWGLLSERAAGSLAACPAVMI